MANEPPRWDLCYATADTTFDPFCQSYFSPETKTVLIIAGAGFDPRSATLVRRLQPILEDRLDALFLREHREAPASNLMSRAEANVTELVRLVPTARVQFVEIFANDGSPVAGRNSLAALNLVQLRRFTDIIVDFSALSIGVSFPIVRQLHELKENGELSCELHLIVVSSPQTDDGIRAIVSDQTPYIHGFQSTAGIQADNRAKLWLPQLKLGTEPALEKLWRQVDPHDTCPILPFPASNARRPDELLYAFREYLKEWRVDPRSIVYASEKNPLDVYRTLVRLYMEREEVFAESGGSQIIVSPIGSKVVAIGTLIAALDRPIAIRYTEAERYIMDETIASQAADPSIVHIWLSDEPNRDFLA
jgi:hypothetical protein